MSKNAKFDANLPFWKNLRVKLNFKTYNFLCRKFAVSTRKLQLPVPLTFLTHDAAF